MFADGILQESFCVEGASQIHAFEEALFCVHYPRQYSAARELEEFNEANLAGDHDALDEEITKKYSTALKVISESQTFPPHHPVSERKRQRESAERHIHGPAEGNPSCVWRSCSGAIFISLLP
jgi:hypothetical protein